MPDLKYALRAIRRMPGVATVVIASLGIGIGVNTAIFSWIESRVLRPLPAVPGSARLQLVEARAQTGSYPGWSWREYLDLRARLSVFGDLQASRMVSLNVGEPGRVERITGALVSGNYFSALRLQPERGRFPTDAEVAAEPSAPIAVVSYRFWQTRMHASHAAVGRPVRVNGQLLSVVGVAPAAFQGTVSSLTFDLWMPATLAPLVFEGSRELEDRGTRGYSAMGFLATGATVAQAQGELDRAIHQFAEDYPKTNATLRGEIMPIYQAPRGPQRFMVVALGALQSLMGLLLLAVCGNAATLMLARANTRQRDISARLAVGASRWHIVRLLLTEGVILGGAAAAVGALVAVWATAALRDVPLPGAFPIEFRTSIDRWALGFAGLLGVGCGVALGVAPALQLARLSPNAAARAGADPPNRNRARNLLIGGQSALAMIVLIAAGLFLATFDAARRTDPGFRREGVLLAAYDLSGRRADASVSLDFARQLLDRLSSLPTVEAVAIASSVPLDIHGMAMREFTLEGRGPTSAESDRTLANTVSPGYFAAMGIALRTGVDFVSLRDTTSDPQVIVNEEFVRRFIGTAEPIGRRLDTDGRSYVVAGVVETSRYEAFDEPATPMAYFSYRDRPAFAGEIHVRARGGDEHRLAEEVRNVIRAIDPELPICNIRTLTEHVERNLVFVRIPARMFTVLGPVLLVLSAVGVYAVVACAVSQKTREIGIRLALGATARRVVRQFVVESFQVVLLGGAAGWIAAWVIQRDVVGRPIDGFVFGAVPLILLSVAGAASWWPARRVTRVDPLIALRQE